MKTQSQQPKGREGAISVLNATIEALDLADTNSSITPAKTVYATVSTLLTMIRVRFLLFYSGLALIHIELGLGSK
jgi:hypothetical protein